MSDTCWPNTELEALERTGADIWPKADEQDQGGSAPSSHTTFIGSADDLRAPSTLMQFLTQTISEPIQKYFAIIGSQSMDFPSTKDKFDALVAAWHEHQIGSARLDFQHSSYHQIIGMGWAAVPYLIERMCAKEPGWMYAVKCITGEQPVPADVRGDAAIQLWLDWAKAKGISIGRP
jgi:hypothetical protein